MSKKKVCIIGMGPAGLMAGTILLEKGFDVHFFDHKKAAGRKFLVAGHGGFNLTHSELIELFIEKFNHPFIQTAVKLFDNLAWIDFLEKIGIQTYVGSSGKIFPLKGIKPIEVLSAWMDRIINLGGILYFSHKFIDFSDKEVIFTKNTLEIKYNFDFLVLAMGGASWKKTGSTGDWKSILDQKEIACNTFEASNSGFELENWNVFSTLEGQTIKNIEIAYNSTKKMGDIIISSYGLEGTPIYFVNKEYRKGRNGYFTIDFKPTKTLDEIKEILNQSKNKTDGLKKLNLSKTVIQFIKLRTTKEDFSSSEIVAKNIKKMKFSPISLRPIDEVISTIGGVSMKSINDTFQLINYQNVFACGEMLDWDAPTGGYLIQGCVSTGFAVGNSISKM